MFWLIGAQGMLGSAVHELLTRRRQPFLASDREVDITDPEALAAFAAPHRISVMLNCAAFTDVRACETEQRRAFHVNGDAVGHLARIAEAKNAHLIHVSTDYVFDGTAAEPYPEDAPPNPLNAYGKSKLVGERSLRASSCRWTLVRTSWLFGEHGPNFVATVLARLGETGRMRVVTDQVGRPTFAPDLAEALLALTAAEPGLYHFANSGTASWFDFAGEIARLAGELGLVEGTPLIEPIRSAELDDPVRRPAFSALATDKIATVLDLRPRPWPQALGDFLTRLQKKTEVMR